MITTEDITELVNQHIEGSDIFLVEVLVKSGNAITGTCGQARGDLH